MWTRGSVPKSTADHSEQTEMAQTPPPQDTWASSAALLHRRLSTNSLHSNASSGAASSTGSVASCGSAREAEGSRDYASGAIGLFRRGSGIGVDNKSGGSGHNMVRKAKSSGALRQTPQTSLRPGLSLSSALSPTTWTRPRRRSVADDSLLLSHTTARAEIITTTFRRRPHRMADSDKVPSSSSSSSSPSKQPSTPPTSIWKTLGGMIAWGRNVVAWLARRWKTILAVLVSVLALTACFGAWVILNDLDQHLGNDNYGAVNVPPVLPREQHPAHETAGMRAHRQQQQTQAVSTLQPDEVVVYARVLAACLEDAAGGCPSNVGGTMELLAHALGRELDEMQAGLRAGTVLHDQAVAFAVASHRRLDSAVAAAAAALGGDNIGDDVGDDDYLLLLLPPLPPLPASSLTTPDTTAAAADLAALSPAPGTTGLAYHIWHTPVVSHLFHGLLFGLHEIAVTVNAYAVVERHILAPLDQHTQRFDVQREQLQRQVPHSTAYDSSRGRSNNIKNNKKTNGDKSKKTEEKEKEPMSSKYMRAFSKEAGRICKSFRGGAGTGVDQLLRQACGGGGGGREGRGGRSWSGEQQDEASLQASCVAAYLGMCQRYTALAALSAGPGLPEAVAVGDKMMRHLQDAEAKMTSVEIKGRVALSHMETALCGRWSFWPRLVLWWTGMSVRMCGR